MEVLTNYFNTDILCENIQITFRNYRSFVSYFIRADREHRSSYAKNDVLMAFPTVRTKGTKFSCILSEQITFSIVGYNGSKIVMQDCSLTQIEDQATKKAYS